MPQTIRSSPAKININGLYLNHLKEEVVKPGFNYEV